MPTRNVVITDHQASLIDSLVKTGRYQNASEVLREGIRLIEVREKEQAAKLEALRAAVQVGIASSERGEFKIFRDDASLKAHVRRIADKAVRVARAR